jgi:hypothetical protein
MDAAIKKKDQSECEFLIHLFSHINSGFLELYKQVIEVFHIKPPPGKNNKMGLTTSGNYLPLVNIQQVSYFAPAKQSGGQTQHVTIPRW